MNELSQVQVLGRPAPKTWDDYRQGCLSTYAGGHHEPAEFRAFQHGMNTVFNLLEAEFPPAEVCSAASVLLDACEQVLARDVDRIVPYSLTILRAAIQRANGMDRA